MKNTKKGFTIVELVIVIAVIAILAAVLIPTFSSVTNSARASAAQQQAKAGLDSIIALTEGSLPDGTLFCITNDTTSGSLDYTFAYTGNKLTQVETSEAKVETFGKTGEYAVYVTASAFTSSTDTEEVKNANDKKAVVEKLLANVIKERISGYTDLASVAISGAAEGGKDYRTLTLKDSANAAIDTDVFRVYWTSDIQETQVVFVGND